MYVTAAYKVIKRKEAKEFTITRIHRRQMTYRKDESDIAGEEKALSEK